jgi:hypothetical protein
VESLRYDNRVTRAASGVAGSLTGVRIRNRIDAAAFRVWVKRPLFAVALGLLGQCGYSLVA